MDRRDFITAAGAAAVGISHRPSVISRRSRLGPLGVQLYTVRTLMQTDFEGTLRDVARIGYREVEFAGYYDRTPQQVRAILDRHHLTAPSAHIDIALLENGWDRMLADAHTMGHRYLVVAWTPQERRANLDGWRRIADLFNHAGETAQQAGIQFAYHNHDYEFKEMDGRLPYDVLCESTDPHFVQMEMDLYWITFGGQDPLAYFARWPGRFPMVHVKDLTRDRHMVDVGAGAIDWRHIFAQRRQAGIRHYFVEHDESPNPITSIRASYRYLSHLNV